MAQWGKECLTKYEPNGVPRRPFGDIQNRYQDAHCCRQQKSQVARLPYKENVEKTNIFGTACSIDQKKLKSRAEREDSCKDESIDIMLLKEIYANMKETEKKYSPLFRRSSAKISVDMRSTFIDWLIYKAESFALDTATLHLAVYYAEKYFSKEEAGVEDFPVVASCAIFLACKVEENRDHLPKVDDLIKHASYGFSRREIFQMEQKMLKALEFQMSYPTSYLFLKVFCSLLYIEEEEAILAQYLCEIALIFENVYNCNEPSKIAAASLVSARFLIGIKRSYEDILHISGYIITDLVMTSGILCSKYTEIKDSPFKRVLIKYSSSRYQNIAERSYTNCFVT